MPTKELVKPMSMPSIFEDFFKPWNEFFDIPGGRLFNRVMNVPNVNIMEYKDDYKIEIAAPGMKKEDFKIDVEGNLLTISAEKEVQFEDKFEKFTRQEFNYANFSRTFTLPEYVLDEKIEAKYEDGVLRIVLPKKDEFKKQAALKHIAVK
ncbi:MAG: Hsp20/alpha crystallin family protein [Candidatus Dadabacteria bacterium]